jgi:serine/threonine protein kinase/lipopolysaccharide biosynthesis regulator YciM
MKAERWKQIEQLYHAALERDGDERASFLAEACSGDASLLGEVERLLAANERADGFLDTPALELEAKNLAAERSTSSLGIRVGQMLGSYLVLSHLGAGGMGEVWRARDTRLDREVAIKVLPASLANDIDRLRRFEQEARATSALNHANILTIYDIGKHEGVPFIVAELLEGAELREQLKDGPLQIRRSVAFAHQIVEGLEAAHEKGIVHRDLKPENIFVTRSGRVKILDFGIAKLSLPNPAQVDLEASTKIQLTNPGMILGTVGYMSPEQVRGREVDHRSDLFSFGVILYEMLTGRRAFRGDSAIEVMSAILKEEPPEINWVNSKVPPQLERIVRRCLEKQPAERFQTASDLRFALEALTTPSMSQIDTLAEMPARKARAFVPQPLARRYKIIIPALLIILGLGYLLSTWRPFQPSMPQPSAKAMPWYVIGTQALRDGSYHQASNYLQKAIEIDAQFSLAHARLAEALAELDYSDESNRELLLVSSQVPDRSRLAAFDRLTLEAIQDTAVRDLPAAIDCYKRMIKLAPAAERAHVYLDLGRAYEKSDEPDKAIECYSKALEYDPQLPTAHLRLGVIYGLRQKDLNNANESFKRAEELFGNNKEGLAEVFFNRGLIYNGLNRLGEARAELKRVAEYGNDHQKIRAILELSGISSSAGNFEQARQETDEGLSLAQKNKMRNVTTQGYLSLAILYHSRGDLDKAEVYYNQAIDSARAYGGRKDTAFAQINLGSLLIQQGRLEDGLREVETAQKFFESADYRNEQLQTLMIIARGKRKKGDHEAAQSAYEQLLPLAERSGDRSLIAQVHIEIGRLLIYQERYPEAVTHIDESYRINQALGLKPKVGYALVNRIYVMWQLGDYREAHASLGEAYLIANQAAGGEKQLLAQIALSESHLALSEQNYKLAIQKSRPYANQAEALPAEIYIWALQILGSAEALSGSVRAGLQHCQEAVTKAESVKDDRLLGEAKLNLARSKAIAGQWQEALTLANQAQELLSRFGRVESEWRAWLVVARSYQSLKQSAQARDAALKAEETITRLRERWGADAYNLYLTRKDIKPLYAQLKELLSQ